MKTIIKSTELLFNGLVEQVVHVERDKLCSEACSGNDVIRCIHSAYTTHMQQHTFSVLIGDWDVVAIREQVGCHRCTKFLVGHLQKINTLYTITK